MDVTEQIRHYNLQYGSSPKTDPGNLATTKALAYANGPNIQNPIIERVSVMPLVIRYVDEIGLFGAENTYVLLELNIQEVLNHADGTPFELTDGYSIVMIGSVPASAQSSVDGDGELIWQEAFESHPSDYDDPDYFEGTFASDLDSSDATRISLQLNNAGTGNRFIDPWLDLRLYKSDRSPYQYDFMYIKPTDKVYLGLHARNTKRLPYNVEIEIGREFLLTKDMTSEQLRYLN